MVSCWLEVRDCCSRPLDVPARAGFCGFRAGGRDINFTSLHPAIIRHMVFISDDVTQRVNTGNDVLLPPLISGPHGEVIPQKRQ